MMTTNPSRRQPNPDEVNSLECGGLAPLWPVLPWSAAAWRFGPCYLGVRRPGAALARATLECGGLAPLWPVLPWSARPGAALARATPALLR